MNSGADVAWQVVMPATVFFVMALVMAVLTRVTWYYFLKILSLLCSSFILVTASVGAPSGEGVSIQTVNAEL